MADLDSRRSTDTSTPGPSRSRTGLTWRVFWPVISLVVLFAIALTLIWTFESPEVLEFKSKFDGHPIGATVSSTENQKILILDLDYCKKKDVKGTVIARLVGKQSIVRLPWPNDTQPANCVKTDVPIVLPDFIGSDEYYLEFEVVYRLNPLKKTDPIIIRSQSFVIGGAN